jgi:hypothetical protein
MTMNSEEVRIWKDTSMDYLKVIPEFVKKD